MDLDIVLIEEMTLEDKWLLESEKYCLINDFWWIGKSDDDVANTRIRKFLYTTRISSNQSILAIADMRDKENENDTTT